MLKLLPPRRKNPSWVVRGTHLGVRVDRSTRTGKREIAQKILRQFERDIERGVFVQAGEPTFADAALAYMKDGGERTYIDRLLEVFGGTPLSRIDQAAIDAAAIELYPGGTPSNRNRAVYTPVSAVLRHAGITLSLRRPRGAHKARRTSWLWPEQVETIVKEATELDAGFGTLLTLLYTTGMRLGEALALCWKNVRLEQTYAYLPVTKNRQSRSVFLPKVTVAALRAYQREGRMLPGGRVFRFTKCGRLYDLLRASAAATEIELPKGTSFHLFRHTWATHMRMYAGADEQGLIATGAWKDPVSVKRYMHTVIDDEARRAEHLPGLRKTG
jgi:integrase